MTTPPRSVETRYTLRLAGHLDRRWVDWFDNPSITHEPDGTTTMRGTVVDQSQLHGLLGRVRDLGATLIVGNIIADLLLAALDPRIRVGNEA